MLLASVMCPLTTTSFSSRSTAPTPNRHTSNRGVLISCFSIYFTKTKKKLMRSPSYFACCRHHPSPRIAIVFSLIFINTAPKFSVSHSSVFLTSSQHIPCILVHFTFSHYVSSTLFFYATGAHLCNFFLLLSTAGIPISSFGPGGGRGGGLTLRSAGWSRRGGCTTPGQP